jgi:hypothetical protein
MNKLTQVDAFLTLLCIIKDLPFDLSTFTKEKLRGVGIGLSSEVVHIAGTNIVAPELRRNSRLGGKRVQ